MYWEVRGYGRKGIAFCAISAVDIGLWDLKAKSVNLPLYKLLGAYTDSVPIYGSGGWTNFSEQELVKEMTDYVESGIPKVKMKVGKDFGQSEREDIQRVEAVRKAVGDDVAIYIDANNGYYRKQSIYMAKEFEQYQIGWLEEPVTADDKAGLAEVRASTDIPIATGESEFTRFAFRDLAERRAADIFQPDLSIAGGISEGIKIEALASAHQIKLAPHLWGGALTFASGLHLVAVASTGFIVEYSLGANPMLHELAEEDFLVEDGFIDIPRRPGLGVTINQEFVDRYRVG